MEYRHARETDIPAIEHLLALSELQKGEVANTIEACVVALQGEKIVGSAALECARDSALLKSFAVHPNHRNNNIGSNLLSQVLTVAYKRKINELFLLTTKAEQFFKRLGFRKTPRSSAPDEIAQTLEFKSLCPESATCMYLNLNKIMQYYPKDTLKLADDIEGVKMWGVSLKNTQFTYFEVEPNRVFEMHHHESEQITYVLKGELYFKTEDKVVCVKAGETIAIPSNLKHGAFTKDQALKAVDAWSPINIKYD